MLSTILTFIEAHWTLISSLTFSLISFVVNIILFVQSKEKSKLKDALAFVPEIIRSVEQLNTYRKMDSVEKKAAAESLIISKYGEKFAKKYIALFDAAIEDVLNTPAKKGEFRDGISKENA